MTISKLTHSGVIDNKNGRVDWSRLMGLAVFEDKRAIPSFHARLSLSICTQCGCFSRPGDGCPTHPAAEARKVWVAHPDSFHLHTFVDKLLPRSTATVSFPRMAVGIVAAFGTAFMMLLASTAAQDRSAGDSTGPSLAVARASEVAHCLTPADRATAKRDACLRTASEGTGPRVNSK
jgi:hypothetical protein